MKKVLLLSGLSVALITMYVLWGQAGSKILVTPAVEKRIAPSPTATPTPTPVIFNSSSSLEEETKKLAPEDYSEDFTQLKKEASNF